MKTVVGGHKKTVGFGAVGLGLAGTIYGLTNARESARDSKLAKDTAKLGEAMKPVEDMWQRTTNDVDYAYVASDISALREYVGDVRLAMLNHMVRGGNKTEARTAAYNALRPVMGTSTWRAAEEEYVNRHVDDPGVLDYLGPGQYMDYNAKRRAIIQMTPHPVDRVLGGAFDPSDRTGREWNGIR